MTKYTLITDIDQYDSLEELVGKYAHTHDVMIYKIEDETHIEVQDPRVVVDILNQRFQKAKHLRAHVTNEVYLKLQKRARAAKLTTDAYIGFILSRHVYGE